MDQKHKEMEKISKNSSKVQGYTFCIQETISLYLNHVIKYWMSFKYCFYVALEIEPKASCMLGKHNSSDLHLNPFLNFLFRDRVSQGKPALKLVIFFPSSSQWLSSQACMTFHHKTKILLSLYYIDKMY
jgi:hypothetical protein